MQIAPTRDSPQALPQQKAPSSSSLPAKKPKPASSNTSQNCAQTVSPKTNTKKTFRRYPFATFQINRAQALDPFALLSLHRFSEAKQAARASLRSDPRSPRARFYPAISLLEQNEANKEALFHLAKAADQLEPVKKIGRADTSAVVGRWPVWASPGDTKKDFDLTQRLAFGTIEELHPADVAELADALVSGTSGGNLVKVQVLSSAPENF